MPITKSCTFCKKPITRPPSAYKRVGKEGYFCNKGCWYSFRSTRGKTSKFSGREVQKRLKGVLYGTACEICGFDRFVEYAHIVPAVIGGTVHPENILTLCPNHHRLFDRDKLTNDELSLVEHRLILDHHNPPVRIKMIK